MARRPSRGVGVRRKEGEAVEDVQARSRINSISGAVLVNVRDEITVEGFERDIRDCEDIIATNTHRIAVFRSAQAKLRGEHVSEVVN